MVDVGVQILTNKEIGTTFSDGRFLITGSFKVRLTKLGAPPNTSLDVNISGPGVFTPTANGGTLITAWGNWLWWFFPGEIAPTGALILTSGHATEILDAGGTPVSFTPPNNSTDACALLASA